MANNNPDRKPATLKLSSDKLQAMATRERAALVNSLSGFKSANLVGTASQEGHCNLAIMSSAVHLGSDPALLGLVIRPGGDERHTLANILASECYSLNHVNADIVAQAHQTAARYHRVRLHKRMAYAKPDLPPRELG